MGTTWGTPALATLSSKKWEVQLGESDQGGAGRKPWGDSHLLPALSQLTPPLPQSRKSIHALSSVTSYYFWIGNPEEFLTEAWRKNKPLCFSPQDKHFQNYVKPEENQGSWGSQPTPASLYLCAGHPKQLSWQWQFPDSPLVSQPLLTCICHLSATWDFSIPSFLPALGASKGHIPEPGSPPCSQPHVVVPPSLLPWGKSFLPHCLLDSDFLTANAEKSLSAPLPHQLQQLWDCPLSHYGRFAALHSLLIPFLAGVSRLCRLSEVRLSVRSLCFGIGRDPPHSCDCFLSQALGHSCIGSLLNLWM